MHRTLALFFLLCLARPTLGPSLAIHMPGEKKRKIVSVFLSLALFDELAEKDDDDDEKSACLNK